MPLVNMPRTNGHFNRNLGQIGQKQIEQAKRCGDFAIAHVVGIVAEGEGFEALNNVAGDLQSAAHGDAWCARGLLSAREPARCCPSQRARAGRSLLGVLGTEPLTRAPARTRRFDAVLIAFAYQLVCSIYLYSSVGSEQHQILCNARARARVLSEKWRGTAISDDISA